MPIVCLASAQQRPDDAVYQSLARDSGERLKAGGRVGGATNWRRDASSAGFDFSRPGAPAGFRDPQREADFILTVLSL